MSLHIPDKATLSQRLRWPALLVLIILLLGWLLLQSWQRLTQGNDQPFNLAKVDTGEVVAVVTGQGRLLPRQSHSVMAEVDGVIQSLELYPGTEVQPGDVLIRMRNPLLQREEERARLAVLEAKAAQEAATARLERESIALENEVAMLEAEIRFAEQEMDTLQTLLEQQILARLDYLRAQTKLEQSRLRHSLSERNVQAFQQARQADERAHQYRLQEAKEHLAMIQQDLAHLVIRAESHGLLNELSEHVEVGKPMRRGDIVAQITEPSSLYADILIAASDASRVLPGQSVQVQVRQHQLQGTVLRVHPSVQHNQVRVEVALPGQLPNNARANLDISARIITAQTDAVVRVPPVLGLRDGHSATSIFVHQGDHFVRRQVHVGILGRDYMEIVDGLQPGDQILLDPPARLQQQTIISTKELTRG
ncbi:HlyD family efflux transporter periplasmic adaptor subunit [Alkalimonas sp. MEB108]|uniref:HlyD family efflux transporter periplasmic adaptor subunit n=1 Tax=Alkalimonas cellulosilytica TaxID=3058395 RepID=A0ABU7J756_9GAMM|nr:HlyD family efflux transporter periplasmic adaptor subunit [Alkalimonas sp. MEB108]MEE2002177.1 HlyD family efflux transporter periplasmic adaptor subunit [Alkalimonas sp. MEB108]